MKYKCAGRDIVSTVNCGTQRMRNSSDDVINQVEGLRYVGRDLSTINHGTYNVAHRMMHSFADSVGLRVFDSDWSWLDISQNQKQLKFRSGEFGSLIMDATDRIWIS